MFEQCSHHIIVASLPVIMFSFQRWKERKELVESAATDEGMSVEYKDFIKSNLSSLTNLVTDLNMQSSDTDASEDYYIQKPASAAASSASVGESRRQKKRLRMSQLPYRTAVATANIRFIDARLNESKAVHHRSSFERIPYDKYEPVDAAASNFIKVAVPSFRTPVEANDLCKALGRDLSRLLDVAALEESVRKNPEGHWPQYRVPVPLLNINGSSLNDASSSLECSATSPVKTMHACDRDRDCQQ